MRYLIIILLFGFSGNYMELLAQPHIPGVVIIHTPGMDGYFGICFLKRCIKNAKSIRASRQSRKAKRKWQAGVKKKKREKKALARKREKYKNRDQQIAKEVPAKSNHLIYQPNQPSHSHTIIK